MTVNEVIREFQRVKRLRAKELKEQNPDMSQKEINKRAGDLSIYMNSRPGYVHECGIWSEIFTVSYDYYSIRGVKIGLEEQY